MDTIFTVVHLREKWQRVGIWLYQLIILMKHETYLHQNIVTNLFISSDECKTMIGLLLLSRKQGIRSGDRAITMVLSFFSANIPFLWFCKWDEEERCLLSSAIPSELSETIALWSFLIILLNGKSRLWMWRSNAPLLLHFPAFCFKVFLGFQRCFLCEWSGIYEASANYR